MQNTNMRNAFIAAMREGHTAPSGKAVAKALARGRGQYEKRRWWHTDTVGKAERRALVEEYRRAGVRRHG